LFCYSVVLFLSIVALTRVKNNWGQLFYIQAYPSDPTQTEPSLFATIHGPTGTEES